MTIIERILGERTRITRAKDGTVRFSVAWWVKVTPSALWARTGNARFHLWQRMKPDADATVRYPLDLIIWWPDSVGDDFNGKKRTVLPTDLCGLGFQFVWKGRLCRVAVKLHASPSPEELKRAWDMLGRAVQNPEAPESGAAWGEEELKARMLDATKP